MRVRVRVRACLCVCVCERQRERERESGGRESAIERGRKREKGKYRSWLAIWYLFRQELVQREIVRNNFKIRAKLSCFPEEHSVLHT